MKRVAITGVIIAALLAFTNQNGHAAPSCVQVTYHAANGQVLTGPVATATYIRMQNEARIVAVHRSVPCPLKAVQ